MMSRSTHTHARARTHTNPHQFNHPYDGWHCFLRLISN
uniref:Uncharacterized protein n=1 Tax=Anguilla anguilla TaxID=7936 RepID=A0A0E9W3V7_ANGAN